MSKHLYLDIFSQNNKVLESLGWNFLYKYFPRKVNCGLVVVLGIAAALKKFFLLTCFLGFS